MPAVNGVALIAQWIALLSVFILPIIIGFTVVRRDANRLGQPGWLWGLLTIPFGWLALLCYVLVRVVVTQGRAA